MSLGGKSLDRGVSSNGTKSGAKLETLYSKAFTEAARRVNARECVIAGTSRLEPGRAAKIDNVQES
jgi:hypothetical protein